jgi:hypothetical protein
MERLQELFRSGNCTSRKPFAGRKAARRFVFQGQL